MIDLDCFDPVFGNREVRVDYQRTTSLHNYQHGPTRA
jgi:hypothetical protein